MNDKELLEKIMYQEQLTRTNLASVLNVSVQFVCNVINGHKNLSNEKKSLLRSVYPSYFPANVIDVPQTLTKESLVEIRNKLGYSQQQLANALGVSRSIINKYESGTRNVSIYTMTKLKSLLGKNINTSSRLKTLLFDPSVVLALDYKPDIELTKCVQIDTQLISNNLNIDITDHKLIVITLGTDSLFPEYNSSDRVILDASIDYFIDGHIFAFVHNGICYVRKVSIMPDKIKCIPLNEKMDTFYLSSMDRYEIYGMVLPRIRL